MKTFIRPNGRKIQFNKSLVLSWCEGYSARISDDGMTILENHVPCVEVELVSGQYRSILTTMEEFESWMNE